MMKRVALLALFLWCGSGQRVRADEWTGRPLVVAIGIDKYEDPQIKPRLHAEADATALVQLFRAKDRLGVDDGRVKLLLGSGPVDGIPSEKATKENILRALSWLEKSADKNDLAILAIFGNGGPVGERACIFGVDSTYQNRAKDAVALGDVEQILNKVRSQRFVTMLDVHYYGFDHGKEKKPDLNVPNIIRVFLNTKDDDDGPSSRTLFIAGAAAKRSLDLEKHGVLAQALLDGLGGQADADGYEGDGNIMISELAKYVRKHVGELTRTNGKNEEEKNQQAGVIEAQSGDFVVAYNPAPRAKALERLEKFKALVQEQKLDENLAVEGRALLARMPKLEARQTLRKAFQKLSDGAEDVAAFRTERGKILDGMKLSEEDAGDYANIILKATEILDRKYFRDVARSPLVGHAIDGMYKRVEEELPADLRDEVAKSEAMTKGKGMSDEELFRLLTKARQRLGKREDLDKGQDVTRSLEAMLAKLDKHTGYIPPEVVKKFREDTAGSFRGIGVQIRRNEARDQLQVITPIINSPAYKAGLKAKDIIATIISEVDPQTGVAYPKPVISPTKGMATEEAVKLIKGKPGTRIKLLVEREGSEKPIEFNLIRRDIEVESVLGYKRTEKDSWNYVIDPENKICYVRLTQFSENTYRELEQVMRQLNKNGIMGFILDLRFNPGGLLDSSIKIADLFIDDGMIVTVRHRDGKETSYVGRSDGSYLTFPMVCLVNGGSASASEIVSACLQDHGRAIIMGSRSFGKGSVQTIHPFDKLSILKITTATFWRPSGRNLNRASTDGKEESEWGVKPNKRFELKLSAAEEGELFDHLREAEIIRAGPSAEPKEKDPAATEFRDRQLDMALEYLRDQIRTARNRPRQGN